MATSSIRDEIRKRYNITEETKKKPDKVSKSVSNITTTISSDPKKYVDDFFADAEKFNSSTKSLFDSMNYQNRNSSYDSYKKQSEDLRSRSNNIRRYLNENKNSFSEKDYNSVISMLDTFDRDTSANAYAFYRKRNAFSAYDTEDDYNNAVKQYGYLQKYGDMSNSDIYNEMSNMEDGEEKDWLNSFYDYNNLRKYGNMSVTDLQKAVWNLEPGAEKDWVSSYYADKIHNMTSGEIAQARENAVVSEEDQLIIEDLLRSNMPYRRDYAEQDGRDMALYDEVESNRNYIAEKYGIVFTESSYDNSQMLANLLQSASSQGENQIAYTTPEGHNITWSKLEQNAKYNEDLQSKFDTYRQMPDWDEKAYTIESVADTESDYMIVTGLARSLVPYSWETAQANGIDRQTWEDTERKRRYINQKYGVDLHNSGYDDITILNNIAANLDGEEGEKEIFELLPQLDQKELQVLSYIYETQGRAAAYAWHKSRMPLYQDRSNNVLTYNMADLGEKNPVAGSLASMYFSLGSGLEYLADIFDYAATGETPNNKYSRASSALRAGVMRGTDWNWGNVDVFDFLYGTGMSLSDTVIAGKIGKLAGGAAGLTDDALGAFAGKVGGTQLGLSTAAQATNDALDRGMSVGQAVIGGMASGVFEGLFESWSIGKFEALQPIDSLRGREIAKNIGKSFLVNASEETLTEVANLAYDYIANGDFSQYETLVRKYVYSGMSETEAKKQASLDLGAQVAEAAASGALMGIVSGTKGTGRAAYQSIAQNHKAKNTYGGVQQELVDKALEIDPDNAFAQKMQGRLDNGKNLSGRQLNRLVQQNEAAITVQDVPSVQNETESRSTEPRETGYVSSIAATESAPTADTADNQLIQKAEELRNTLAEKRIQLEETKKILADPNANAFDKAGLDFKAYKLESEVAELEKSLSDLEASGKLDVSKAKNANQVTIEERKTSTAANDRQVTGKLTSKESLQVAEKSTATEKAGAKAVTLEKASEKYGDQAQAMIHTYREGQDVKKFDQAYRLAYNWGQSGVSESYVNRLLNEDVQLDGSSRTIAGVIRYLTKGQVLNAYAAGKDAASFSANKLDSENKAKNTENTARKEGTVRGDGVTVKDLSESLNDTQQMAYQYLVDVAKATGIDIVLYRSQAGADGKFKGAQGMHNRNDPGTLHIDLNAGLYNVKDVNDLHKYAMLRTFTHEFVHFIEYHNPVQYNEFRKVVFDTMESKGEDVHGYIIDKQNHGLSYEMASREVVAEALTDILPDSNFVQELAQKHKNIFQWLLDKLKEFANNLKKYYKTIGGSYYEGATALKEQVGDTVKYMDSIVKMFDQAAVQAVENFQKTAAAEAQKNTTEDGGVQMQTRSVNGEQVVWIENSGFTNKQLHDYSAIAEFIAEHIGEYYTIIESGQNVYIGEDLPNEYTHSRYTSFLQKKKPALLKAKNRASTALGEMIEIATNRRWEPTEHKASKDAKYGMYRYDTKFAFPIKNNNGNVTDVKAYDAELLIRNASDGKKYLYDIVNIKEDTTNALDLRHKEARKGSYKATTQGDVINDNVAQNTKDVKNESSEALDIEVDASTESVAPTVQYQQRENTLTDRDVLAVAASEVDTGEWTAGEKEALGIFAKRLKALEDLQTQRTEQGRIYREQRFGPGGDRKAADKTLNRMHVLDEQISRAAAEVLDVENKEVLRKVLKKARSVVEQQDRAHFQEVIRRKIDRMHNAADIKKYRERIRRDVDELTDWVMRPDNKSAVKHIPDALKNTVIPFLNSIDFTSKRALRGGEATQKDKAFAERLSKLAKAMKDTVGIDDMYANYNDLPPDFVDKLTSLAATANQLLAENSGEHIINRMTSEDLGTLSKVVRTLKKHIKEMNQFHVNAMFKHVYDAGNNSISFMKKMEPAKNTGAVSQFLLWQQMRPAYAFERFGDGGVAVYDGLRRGQATMAFNTNKILEFSEKAYTTAEVKKWDKDVKTIDLGDGKTIKMRVSQIMSLYELNKREQARWHLYGDGLRVSTFQDGNKKVAHSGDKVSVEDVDKIISQLTPRQKEVADQLQQFMQKQGGEWGNHVTLARFGEKQFGEENYFPINSDGRHLEVNADEKPGASALYALLNMGFTKQTQEKAKNRLIVYSIFDVFANHMASMAQYNAFALPVIDALKWFNYKQVSVDENGKQTVAGSVRDQMDRVYGTPVEKAGSSGKKGYAQNFVINILKAFNGTEAQGTTYDGLGMKALSHYNRAQVAYNLRVVLQQPMAITRAAQLIDYRSILKGLKLSPAAIKRNVAEMREHSGIAAWKALGFYDVNISRGLTSLIKRDETGIDKVIEFGMKGAELADTFTWGAMWSACKEEVIRKQKMKPGDKGFFEAVTNLFEDVVYKTQVVDSVLTKNEFMRDKGFFAKAIGSFMSEPTTTASMLVDAFDKLHMDRQRGMTPREAWKKNKKKIIRTAYVYGVGSVLLAAVQAVADAFRDDDDYEEWLEKWKEAFSGNLVDELIPLNKLPIVSDFYDLGKELLSVFGVDTYGNPPQSVFMQWYDSLVKGVEIIYGKITGEEDRYTWYGGAYKLLQAASGLAGLPMAGATREIVTAWNNIVGAMAPSLKVKTYDPGDLKNIQYAYQDGYLTEEEAIAELLDKGLVDTENEAYFKIRGWESGEGYSRYDAIYNAVRNGGDISEAMQELTSHGYAEKDVLTQVKSKIGSWYKDGQITKQQTIDMLTKYMDMDSDEITATVNKWSSKVVTGIAFEDIKDEYLEGSITADRAIEMYVRYGGYTEEKATETVTKWGAEKETGIAYNDIEEAFLNGEITEKEAKNMYIQYGGLTEEKAKEKVIVMSFVKDHPGMDDISYSAVENYNTYCKASGVSAQIYYDAWKHKNSLSGSVKESMMGYIHRLKLTAKQKDSLYYAFGWKESTIDEAPWH